MGAQAANKKAISKTRVPVSEGCLITDANLCAGDLRCNQPRKTAVIGRRYSLNDALANSEVPRSRSCLAIGSKRGTREVGLSGCHFLFCVSFCHDAFLRSRGASGKQPHDPQSKHPIPRNTLIHEANLLIEKPDATTGIRASMLNETSREKVLRGQRSSRLVLHGRQLGRA